MKSLLDRSFKYVPAASTDIRRTFARIRAEQKAAQAASDAKVSPIKRRASK